ncbi:hypothetical protein [Brevundimonas sp. PAMC22021]|uniref:hypothetical protein n=1 Tax=Brevundimonas sp. PAMC22021 TaxID=2861285 RepID=UPI001C629604|nr:hypothetical protein [Brevundimonas sp. PAMC22021]QYF87281.1 hypothetical protein KY493_01840 [Brevundimonas sp. PAMC22021]
MTADHDRQEVANPNNHPAVREAALGKLNELFHIESTLATYQLADAQRELVAAQTAATRAQEAATDELRIANAAADDAKTKGEEVQFWSRRFLTNLLVANAAGFVAVLTFMVKTDSPVIRQEDVLNALACFGSGAVLGGCVPLFRIIEVRFGSGFHKVGPDAQPRKSPWGRFYSDNGLNFVAAVGGSILLAMGIMVVIGCARGYYAAKSAEMPREREVVVRVVQVPTSQPT